MAAFRHASHDEIELCEGARRAVTDDEGAYRFELKGADTQGSVGNAVTWVFAASTDALDGEVQAPVAEASTIIDRVEVEIPVVRLWRAALGVSPQGEGYALSWDEAPADVSGAATYTAALGTPHGDAWRTSGAPTNATWRDTDVEDFEGTLAVADGRGTSGVESFHVRHTSQRVPWTPGDAVPQSRGAACFVDREGASSPVEGPCPATDGDLGTSLGAQGPSCTPPEPADGGPSEACDETNDRFFGVDLGAARAVARVYVRGGHFLGGHAVEIAGEDGVFVEAGRLEQNGGPSVVELPPATSARYVRVRNLEEGRKVGGAIAELSVF